MKNKNITIIFLVLSTVIISALFYNNKIKEKYLTHTIYSSTTILNITAETGQKNFEKTIIAVTNEINLIDNILNPYNKKSEIALLNKKSSEGETEIDLSETLYFLFEKGFMYAKLSNYHFDISVGSLMDIWGIDTSSSNQTVPSKHDINYVLNKKSGSMYASIRTNSDKSHTLLLEKPLTFDLGSFGKGFILSKLVEIFKSNNIKNFLIDFGGDTYAYGLNPKKKPWVVAIKKPREYMDNDYLAIIMTTNASIVTSGDYERYFIEDGIKYHHILDAKIGYPSEASISATIVDTDPLNADALSTISFLLGSNFYTNSNFNYSESYLVTEKNNNVLIFIETNR